MLLAVVQPWPEGKQPTDAALMERILQRDSGALEALYDRYGRPVYSLVLRIAQHPSSAEEIVQDVFCSSGAARTGFKSREDLSSRGCSQWLATARSIFFA